MCRAHHQVPYRSRTGLQGKPCRQNRHHRRLRELRRRTLRHHQCRGEQVHRHRLRQHQQEDHRDPQLQDRRPDRSLLGRPAGRDGDYGAEFRTVYLFHAHGRRRADAGEQQLFGRTRQAGHCDGRGPDGFPRRGQCGRKYGAVGGCRRRGVAARRYRHEGRRRLDADRQRLL